MADLLLEIGTEEIPAGYILSALEVIETNFKAFAAEAHLSFKELRTVATPRRLTLSVSGLDETQQTSEVEAFGPRKEAAYEADGSLTKAAQGFARAQGVEPSQLFIKAGPKGECLCARKKVGGAKTSALLQEALPKLIEKITFPKSMRWIPASKITFARPVRYIAAVFGSEILDFECNMVRSGRRVRGHFFLSPEWLELKDANLENYLAVLEKHFVIADHRKRQQIIERQIKKIMQKHGSTEIDADLLEEVTFMVEWPNALEGSFPQEFLEVPEEVLVASMTGHQRYFPVRNAAGKLEAKFVLVANRDGGSDTLIREGNERVLKARLSDARFFWNSDLKKTLDSRRESLKAMSYLKNLGNYFDKTERVAELAALICRDSKGNKQQEEMCRQAGRLSKADLCTDMVFEFTELQGIMGRYYAAHDGLPQEVCSAIDEHYWPRQSGGKLPQTMVGSCLSAAEKIDTIVGAFLIGEIPSGSQDPYGLRRAAIGLIRMATEGTFFNCALEDSVRKSVDLYHQKFTELKGEIKPITDFFAERVSNLMINQGYRYDLVDATLAPGFADLRVFGERLRAVVAISGESWFNDLVTSVERSKNILKGATVEAGEPSADLLKEEPEKALFDVYTKARKDIGALLDKKDFEQASRRYGQMFSEPLHTFFDKVFVNVEDAALRANRLKLLRAVNELYVSRVADLSKVVEGRK